MTCAFTFKGTYLQFLLINTIHFATFSATCAFKWKMARALKAYETYIITLLLKNYLVILLFYIGFNLIIKLLSVDL